MKREEEDLTDMMKVILNRLLQNTDEQSQKSGGLEAKNSISWRKLEKKIKNPT